MKPRMSVLLYANLLLQLCVIATIKISFCSGSSYVGCIESQRQALLKFKQDLKDPSNRLASWTGDGDCCTWAGVDCNNLRGHVLELHLGNPRSVEFSSSYEEVVMDIAESAEYEAYWRSMLVGKITPALLDFKHLIYLDLNGNDYQGAEIPKFLGSMGNLRYLNLSGAGFGGKIPHQLGNLSNLKYLDLDSYYIGHLYVENLWLLSSLSFLEHLNLNGVNLSKASDWLLVTNSLSSLKVLQLSGCELQHFQPLPIANFSSLAVLSLSFNQFDSPLILRWVFGLCHLVFFEISGNQFSPGPIPDGLQNCTSLRHPDLSDNNFNSSIPDWFSKFTRLEYLDLSSNSLKSTISEALLTQTSLKSLDLSFNILEQRIPRAFGRLCNLRSIYLIGTILSQEIEEILEILSACISDGLESLDLSNNLLFGHFTNKLGQFKSLHALFLRNNSISGPIPVSLGELSSLRYLDFSHNKLNGTLSQSHFANLARLSIFYLNNNFLILKVSHDWVPPFQLKELVLRSFYLGTRFPSWIHSQKHLINLDLSNSIVDIIPIRFWNFSSQILVLNLSRNQIHGEIPDLSEAPKLHALDRSSNNLSGRLPIISSSLRILDFSNNAFSGLIFHFLCYEIKESKQLLILKIGRNLLSGQLPDCWMNWQNLIVLNLDNNKFSGNLPNSLGALSSLLSLHLQKNRITGAIPVQLKNCTTLEGLDIGENAFVGNIPTWIGEGFLRMKILNFRSNKFYGSLPTELCSLASLQILDVSYNNLSGWIPRCIDNLSTMVTIGRDVFNEIDYIRAFEENFIEEALIVTKGKMLEYNSNLNLVRSVDFSNNNFSGEIPMEITHLAALQTLNLSFNFFTGKIPEKIGAMTSLESLDFSANQLSGEIPSSMSTLTFLSHLNLSNNNLIRKIPSSTQLQSLESSFMGNELCGPPLPQNCTMTISILDHKIGDGNVHEVDWFYVSMVFGFVVSFWGLIGPLVVNRRWRYIYCHFLDLLGEKFVSVVRKSFEI